MGILKAMGKAAVKEVKRGINRKKREILRKATKKASGPAKRKVRRLPASSVTRRK